MSSFKPLMTKVEVLALSHDEKREHFSKVQVHNAELGFTMSEVAEVAFDRSKKTLEGQLKLDIPHCYASSGENNAVKQVVIFPDGSAHPEGSKFYRYWENDYRFHEKADSFVILDDDSGSIHIDTEEVAQQNEELDSRVLNAISKGKDTVSKIKNAIRRDETEVLESLFRLHNNHKIKEVESNGKAVKYIVKSS